MNNLWQNPENKKWYADIQINGRRMRPALSYNLREAQRMVDDMKALRRSSKSGELPKKVSWGFFKSRLYDSLRAEGIGESTIKEYDLAFRRLESKVFMKYIDQLTPERLDFARSRWAETIGSWAIENHLRFIKAAMHRAEDWKFIGLQNWRIVKPKPVVHRKIHYTPEQLLGVIENSPEPWALSMRLMGRAGLRSSEVGYLTWADCDFGQHLIRIRKKNGWHPKAKKGICKDRDIPMSEDLFLHLLKVCHDTHARPQDYVLGGDKPTPYTKNWFEVKKCLNAIGLEGYPHAFRHTLASHLSQRGVGLTDTRDIMGHASITTTQIYTHSSQESSREAIKKLPNLVAGLRQVSTSSKGLKGPEKV